MTDIVAISLRPYARARLGVRPGEPLPAGERRLAVDVQLGGAE